VPGVYVSYPFCAQKCTYCNFASGVFPQGMEARYLEALRAEIARHAWAWRPETVYLGGGTPSAMEPQALASVLARIPGRPWLEATLETAPGSVTPERTSAWEAAGIDRVSLGVQSFVQPEIARTGRKHTAQLVASEVDMLRAAGIAKINIDLIAGLSGQTAASWRESLDWIARLEPDHVSVYNNMKYWLLEPYAGFGSDAHSFDGRLRWQNPESLHEYLGAWQPVSVERNPLEERLFVGLRLTQGIRPEPLEWEHFGEPIRRFIDQGLLETDGQVLRLTSRGVMLSNEVFQEFLT